MRFAMRCETSATTSCGCLQCIEILKISFTARQKDCNHQSELQKQKMSKEQLISMLSATSNLLDEREDIIEYINSLQVGVALNEKQIKEGYQKFREQKNNWEINVIAKKHGIEIQSLQAFIQEIIDRMIFDGEKLSDLLAPLALSWRERTQKELDLMDDLIPFLKKLVDGREIVGLNAYE